MGTSSMSETRPGRRVRWWGRGRPRGRAPTRRRARAAARPIPQVAARTESSSTAALTSFPSYVGADTRTLDTCWMHRTGERFPPSRLQHLSGAPPPDVGDGLSSVTSKLLSVGSDYRYRSIIATGDRVRPPTLPPGLGGRSGRDRGVGDQHFAARVRPCSSNWSMGTSSWFAVRGAGVGEDHHSAGFRRCRRR